MGVRDGGVSVGYVGHAFLLIIDTERDLGIGLPLA